MSQNIKKGLEEKKKHKRHEWMANVSIVFNVSHRLT